MRILDVKQGSPEWIQARLAIPTASQYHRIITPKTGKLSGQADAYRNELLAELMLGEQVNDVSSEFMLRGTAYEKSAVEYYQFQRDMEIERVGFILRDDGRTGCSPDGLVGEDGGVEIKIPSAAIHVGHLIDGPDDKYKAQIQGCLYITGRQWWDWVSFNPDLPPVILRMQRDEEFIGKLEAAVDQFVGMLAEAREKLVDRGYLVEERELVLV